MFVAPALSCLTLAHAVFCMLHVRSLFCLHFNLPINLSHGGPFRAIAHAKLFAYWPIHGSECNINDAVVALESGLEQGNRATGTPVRGKTHSLIRLETSFLIHF